MGCCLSTRNQQVRPDSNTSSPSTHSVSDPHLEYAEQEHGNEGISGHEDEPEDVLSSVDSAAHVDETEETVITSILATDLALGLRRLPAGFYAMVHHSGLGWRTENKPISANSDDIEWSGPIPIPSDLSAGVSLAVQASFEFQPMLGDGEQLREFTITVEQLLDHCARNRPFNFLPNDGDVISPCSSLLVTVGQRRRESNGSSILRVLKPNCSAVDSPDQLEDATNHGHSALSRYRKGGENSNLERAVEHFEYALSICPLDHPCYATAQSNMAMAKLIQCRVHGTDISIDIALSLYRNTLAARPVGHPDRPSTLIQLAGVHLARFEKGRDEADGEQVQAFLYEVLDLSAAESHENRAANFMLQLHADHTADPVLAGSQSFVEQDSASDVDLRNLALELLEQFERFGDIADLQQAVSYLEAFLKSIPALDPLRVSGLANLAIALSYRFGQRGELSDLEEAILKQREVVDLIPDGDPRKPACLNNLGLSLLLRFQRLGELSDLGEAISRQRDAVNAIPDGHPEKPTHLINLGNVFRTRFQYLGEIADLEETISRQQDAVGLTPDGHPNKPGRLDNLGSSFLIRFRRLGDISDLEQAITRQHDAVHLTPDSHPNKPGYLNNLGSSFISRFECLGDISDLEEALSSRRDAVDLISAGHPDKPMYLTNLGNSFLARFEHLGELNDLAEAISSHRDAVNLTPDGYPDKPERLSNLGNSLVIRFERLGELSDLEDAVSRQRDAVDLIPDSRADKPACLNNLSNSFLSRFERLGEISDLETAISRQQDAINLIPDGHADKPMHLINLANCFFIRFERLGEIRDLEEAISIQRVVVDELTPDGDLRKPGRQNSLGISLVRRFECIGELGDLEEAISTQRAAVDLTPDSHLHKPARLNNLGECLRTRFEHLGEINDLEAAISRQRDAVNLTPDGHPNKPNYLDHLSISFVTRFQRLGELSDLEEAVSLSSHAACSPIGPISDRFRASHRWIFCARLLRHHSLLSAYSVAVGLLPQCAWIGLSLAHRYRELIQDADVVREAAAAALDSGHPETAVEWLEQGRSIVWGELFQLRSSYDELSSAHPVHARRLRELSATLEQASADREKFSYSQMGEGHNAEHSVMESLQREADTHRALAIERDKLLQDIRALPGFERFLLHKQFSQLRASAHSGPVAILNAAGTRCDALVILADVDPVVHVPLANFTLARCMEFQASLKGVVRHSREVPGDDRYGQPVPQEQPGHWKPILAPLWKCAVKPVLDALAISTPGDLSHIYWCPTGPFTFLPIHAAGFYDTRFSEPGHKVFDFVVSSYVPTLSILASPTKPVIAPHSGLRLLAVRQPLSDGKTKLPGVVTELEFIKTVIEKFPSARTALVEPSVGTVEEVLALMKDADWVHFACHGVQDDANPTDSGLCLADGRRLRVSDMIALSRPHGGLSFLSACQTAVGDEDLSDEAIHIAAGMLFAGYGGVVATMWSISDKLAPDVTKDVYEQLFRNGTIPDYRDAARALHIAVGRLRESRVPFQDWLPFIHVGL